VTRPRLLDLFCGAGGCSAGYARAGFDVVGVDLHKQRRYPFEFHHADALTYPLDGFDVVHASPPCQAYSVTRNAHSKSDHPDLLPATLARLREWGGVWVVENVPGAPIPSALTLCGSMFGLTATDTDGLPVWLRRHRLFESNILLYPPGHCAHPTDMLCAGVYGNGSPTHQAARARAGGYTPPSEAVRRQLMGIDWMTRKELTQAIPPVFTEYIGEQLMDYLTATRGVA